MPGGDTQARTMPHCSAGPSPRIFIYDIPESLLSRPTQWRLVYDVGAWIRNSPHWERQGDCADYFFVPMHPKNMANGRMTGDANFARLYAYIRETWPYWNRTVDEGTARHFHMLPCDHGPGDCGYDRPLIPNKWSPGMHSLVEQNQRNHVVGFLNQSDATYIRKTWGGMWEQLNPASPSRLVFYLVYNGWADQLRSQIGQCRSCFHAGLDVRATPPAASHARTHMPARACTRLHAPARACTRAPYAALRLSAQTSCGPCQLLVRRSGYRRQRATSAARCAASTTRSRSS